MFNTKFIKSLILIAILFITACGGSSGSGSEESKEGNSKNDKADALLVDFNIGAIVNAGSNVTVANYIKGGQNSKLSYYWSLTKDCGIVRDPYSDKAQIDFFNTLDNKNCEIKLEVSDGDNFAYKKVSFILEGLNKEPVVFFETVLGNIKSGDKIDLKARANFDQSSVVLYRWSITGDDCGIIDNANIKETFFTGGTVNNSVKCLIHLDVYAYDKYIKYFKEITVYNNNEENADIIFDFPEQINSNESFNLSLSGVSNAISYKWTVSGNLGTFSSATVANPIFTAANISSETTAFIYVEVQDKMGKTYYAQASFKIIPVTVTHIVKINAPATVESGKTFAISFTSDVKPENIKSIQWLIDKSFGRVDSVSTAETYFTANIFTVDNPAFIKLLLVTESGNISDEFYFTIKAKPRDELVSGISSFRNTFSLVANQTQLVDIKKVNEYYNIVWEDSSESINALPKSFVFDMNTGGETLTIDSTDGKNPWGLTSELKNIDNIFGYQLRSSFEGLISQDGSFIFAGSEPDSTGHYRCMTVYYLWDAKATIQTDNLYRMLFAADGATQCRFQDLEGFFAEGYSYLADSYLPVTGGQYKTGDFISATPVWEATNFNDKTIIKYFDGSLIIPALGSVTDNSKKFESTEFTFNKGLKKGIFNRTPASRTLSFFELGLNAAIYPFNYNPVNNQYRCLLLYTKEGGQIYKGLYAISGYDDCSRDDYSSRSGFEAVRDTPVKKSYTKWRIISADAFAQRYGNLQWNEDIPLKTARHAVTTLTGNSFKLYLADMYADNNYIELSISTYRNESLLNLFGRYTQDLLTSYFIDDSQRCYIIPLEKDINGNYRNFDIYCKFDNNIYHTMFEYEGSYSNRTKYLNPLSIY